MVKVCECVCLRGNLKTLTITGIDHINVVSYPRCRKVTSKVALCGQGVYVQ